MNELIQSLPLAVAIDHNLVPISLFAAIAAIVFFSLNYKNQRDRMWHETARIALEKGQPIPPRSDEPAHRDPRLKALGLFIAGTTQLGVGTAMHFFGRPHLPAFIGPMIGFSGVALLLSGMLALFLTRKNDDPASKS